MIIMPQQPVLDLGNPGLWPAWPRSPRHLICHSDATSILGLRSSKRASHEPSGIDLRPSQFNRDMAPMMSMRRISVCPALETRPSRSLPPEEFWRGTRPSHAAKPRPQRKLPIGGANASTARAVSGPIPGMVCSRRAASVMAVSSWILRVLAWIRAVCLAICASRSLIFPRISGHL